MKPLAIACLTALLALAEISSAHGEPQRDQRAAVLEQTVVGQLELPHGDGRRGVELRVTVAVEASDDRTTWVQFDAEGRFSHTFSGRLTSVTVTAGNFPVQRINADVFPEASRTGLIDTGVIDLRGRLMRHRLVLRAAEGSSQGDVRVAMWSGPPPVGPWGEPVSLGSSQFPTRALGDEMEWLVPNDAQAIYFLAERPSGPGRGRAWRSGHQRLFGPFSSETLPTELVVD